MCAPLYRAAKTSAVRPIFARVVGELGAAGPRICSKDHEAKMLVLRVCRLARVAFPILRT